MEEPGKLCYNHKKSGKGRKNTGPRIGENGNLYPPLIQAGNLPTGCVRAHMSFPISLPKRPLRTTGIGLPEAIDDYSVPILPAKQPLQPDTIDRPPGNQIGFEIGRSMFGWTLTLELGSGG